MVEGTYVFRLTVTDNQGNTTLDEVNITLIKSLTRDTTLRTPENPLNTIPGVTYEYYEGDWTSIPVFNNLQCIGSGEISNFSISKRLKDDLFGMQFTGYIDIPKDDNYTFYLGSDDGSRLYIGNQLVVDNDKTHGYIEKSGKIGLKKGNHKIIVDYSNQNTQISWKFYGQVP